MEFSLKRLSEWMILVIASVGVIVLWLYAFIVASDTLAFPFVGQARQEGKTWSFPVALPSRIAELATDGALLDTSILLDILTVNGEPLTDTQKDQLIVHTQEDAWFITPYEEVFRTGDVFRIRAKDYNEAKKTGYRLSSDVEFIFSTNAPKELRIAPLGDPKEKQFSVEMYGFSGLDIGHVRWYAYTSSDPNERCIGEGKVEWDSRKFTQIPAKILSQDRRGPRFVGTVRLDIPVTASRQCVIAGINDTIQSVVNRTLEPFTLTGTISDVLSPEYDMQSRIDIRFSERIFSDTGTIYSPEYITHRTEQKKKILSQLEVMPDIGLWVQNIILTPDKMSIVADFKEGTSYRIALNDVEDIYGQKSSLKMNFLPQKKPFLSVVLENNKTMFTEGEDIYAKIYSLSTPKNEYSIKLCSVELHEYAQTERIETERKKEYSDAFYELFHAEREGFCVKKDITLNTDASVTSFRVNDLVEDGNLPTGLYVLAFRNQEDTEPFERFVSPRVFSVIDSHITMKVNTEGKMQFLVTDIKTGEPRSDMEVEYLHNIGKTADFVWIPEAGKYDTVYTPLSHQSFGTGVILGKTDTTGIFAVDAREIENENISHYTLYGNTHEITNDNYYPSFLAIARSGDHFGYIVSTWNDGISGWNFGMKSSEYGWFYQNHYSAYIHTDRRLYLPGETVYIHAIVRENGNTLSIPQTDTRFNLIIRDSRGGEVKNVHIRPNEFGTIVTDYVIPEDAHLGNFSVQLFALEERDEYIDSGWTSFQVEVFQKPNFTADVTLTSPDIQKDMVQGVRKNTNTDVNNPWYDHVYTAPITLEGVVKGYYYNGANMKNIPFRYRVLRSVHYDNDYWDDCFWGCYFNTFSEFYTEGEGMIGSDGIGYMRIPVKFTSFANDYVYTVEVTIQDPLTGESVTTPATLLAKMPTEYKQFFFHEPLKVVLANRMLRMGEEIQASFEGQYRAWSSDFSGRYMYEIIRQKYSTHVVDDLRMKEVYIPRVEGIVVATGTILEETVSLSTDDMESGEYQIRVTPIVSDGSEPPEHAVRTLSFFIAGQENHHVGEVQVLPEKTIYEEGEKARVFFVSPFPDGHLYITREKGGIIDSKYITLQNSTHIEEYTIDATFEPNVYIGAVAFPGNSYTGSKTYSVGYGEMITDMTNKKLNIRVLTNKNIYKNRDTVELTMTMTDQKDVVQTGEFAVMVVDESLVRLLGNIDLDILPKFYQKFPFSVRTALTRIGMEQNRFLSRRGISGGSGDKGSSGTEISSRTLFKNTVYFNGSVITDEWGRATVEFTLPDNVTDYRIIVIGQTKTSRFGVAEKTMSVRRDYTIDAHIPAFAYPGDTFSVDITGYNATKTITSAKAVLSLRFGDETVEQEKDIIMNVEGRSGVSFDVTIPEGIEGNIEYSARLVRGDTVLDSIEKTIPVYSFPIIQKAYRSAGSFTGEVRIPLVSKNPDTRIELHIGNSFLLPVQTILGKLQAYPYWCAEQTLAGILAHAYAMEFGGMVDREKRESYARYIENGLQKLSRMYVGGWKYWETDMFASPHVSPYVLRGMLDLRDLGVIINPALISGGADYVEGIVAQNDPALMKDMNYQAELFATLARVSGWDVSALKDRLDPEMLSRHGMIMYAYGLHFMGEEISDSLSNRIESLLTARENPTYYYWSLRADQALYAQLLVLLGKQQEAASLIDELLRSVDVSSYFVSTQEYIQLFRAVLLYTKKYPPTDNVVMLESLWTKGEIALTSATQTGSRIMSFTKSSLGDEMILRNTKNTPVIYELREIEESSDVTKIIPENTNQLSLTQKIELIDESKGLTPAGEFVSATEVQNNILEYGKLYRVTTQITLQNMPNAPWRQLVLENFTAAWVRAMTAKYKTESKVLATNSERWDWTYTETKPDRIFAEIEHGYGNKIYIYTYYFRTEFRGEYIMPPPTAYFMYQPEIHAVGTYRKLIVH